jgi:hypothetical protein
MAPDTIARAGRIHPGDGAGSRAGTGDAAAAAAQCDPDRAGGK